MIEIITKLVGILKWLPVAALVAIVQVAVPFPNFLDRAAVQEWLDRLVVGGPLADLILGFLPTQGPIIMEAGNPTYATGLIESVCKDQGILDPTKIKALVDMILMILQAIGVLRQE